MQHSSSRYLLVWKMDTPPDSGRLPSFSPLVPNPLGSRLPRPLLSCSMPWALRVLAGKFGWKRLWVHPSGYCCHTPVEAWNGLKADLHHCCCCDLTDCWTDVNFVQNILTKLYFCIRKIRIYENYRFFSNCIIWNPGYRGCIHVLYSRHDTLYCVKSRAGHWQRLHNLIHITLHGPRYDTDMTKIITAIYCRIHFFRTALIKS